MTENRTLTVSPHIIYSLIKAQAGSLAKGLLECVMNSIDAGATRVDIELASERLRVVDDGRGFRSRQEIEACFEVFGFKHKEGDRVYGQFGIGRAQLWNFCSTVWRTNSFEMAVDIRAKGLDYVLKEKQPHQPGLVIEGRMYEPLKTSDLLAVERELTELALYAQIPVTLNGHRINRDPAKEKWTHETEQAWIRLKEHGDLVVYNLGVFVRRYPGYTVGSGGVVVTKPGVRLALNMARNDILQSECRVWKKIKPFLQKQSDRRVSTKRTRMSAEELENLALRYAAGELDADTARAAKLVTDYQGRSWTVDDLLDRSRCTQGRAVTAAPAGSRLAERVHTTGQAFVLAEVTLARFGVESVRDFGALLERLHERTDYLRRGAALPRIQFVNDFRECAGAMTDAHLLVPYAQYTPEEKAALAAVQRQQWRLVHALEEALNGAPSDADELRQRVGQRCRHIALGESDTAYAWTDGAKFIALNRSVLAKAREGLSGWQTIVNILVHEYLHDEDDTGSHEHDAAFHQSYHDLMTDPRYAGLNDCVAAMYRHYVSLCRARKLKLRANALLDLDAVEEAYGPVTHGHASAPHADDPVAIAEPSALGAPAA